MPFVVPPLLLVAVLVVSAVAKLRDPHDTASVFRQLALPQLLLRVRAPRLLPYGELVVAAGLLLIPGRGYVVATLVTLLLFGAYFLVILQALRLPHPVTCSCFGRLGLGEVTRRTLARNAVLLALALVTWLDSWRAIGVGQRLDRLGGAAWWIGGIVAVGAVTLVVRLWRPTPAVLEDPDPEGYRQVAIPDGVLHDVTGAVRVWQLSDAAARLLVFCDPAVDQEVVAHASTWVTRVAPVRVHLVTESGPVLDGGLLDPGSAFRHALGAGSPGAVLLGTDRMLAGGPVTGLEEITELVEAMVAELAATENADEWPQIPGVSTISSAFSSDERPAPQ